MKEFDMFGRVSQEGSGIEKESSQLQKFSQLFDDIEIHNRDNSEGALLGKALGRAIAQEIGESGDPKDVGQDVREESLSETYSGLTLLRSKYSDVLRYFGVELDREHSQFDKEHLLSTLRMRVVDGAEFVKKLQMYRLLLQTSEYQPLLKKMIESIGRQVYFDSIDGISPEDKQTFTHLGEISASLASIAPSLDRERIETYRRFNEQGRLENYVLVEQAGLWHKQGEGFGPADWIKDSTHVSLDEKYWKKALDVYQDQKRRGSLGVASELQEHLLLCLTQSAEYIEQNPKMFPGKSKELTQAVLAKYTKALIGQQSLN